MTPRYWIKIVLGMLAIFTVGMFVVSGINAAKSKVVHLVESGQPITVPLFGMPFRTVAGGELGRMQQLRIERSEPRVVEGFHLTVRLNDGVDVDQFDHCEVSVIEGTEIDENTRFSCLTEADADFEDLVQFGTVTFRPSGEVHRLMLPSSAVEEIRGALVEDHASAAESVSVDGSDGDGRVVVKVNGRSLVDIRGGEHGGSVTVSDPVTHQKVVEVKGTP